jgi:hypothetical protein
MVNSHCIELPPREELESALTGREMSGTPRGAGAPVARRGEHRAGTATFERHEDVRSMAW